MKLPRVTPTLLTAALLILLALAAGCGSDGSPVVTGAPASGDDPAELPVNDAEGNTDTPAEEPVEEPGEPSAAPPATPGTDPLDLFDTDWIRVEPRNDLISPVTGEILDLGVLDDTHVLVRFTGAPEGCGGARGVATESGSTVEIELLVGIPPEAISRGCPAVIEHQEIVVELAAPLGTRSLVAVNPAPSTGATAELSLDDYIGLTVEDAIAKAELSGRPARVVRVNGEPLASTDDYLARRLNFEVVDNIVIGLTTDAGERAGDAQGL